MTHLIRRGRLEVETDLLLGVGDVLLPLGHGVEAIVEVAEGAEAVVQRNAPPAKPAGRFDAALFSPTRSEPSASTEAMSSPRSEKTTSLTALVWP
jgi:hypothetical protein